MWDLFGLHLNFFHPLAHPTDKKQNTSPPVFPSPSAARWRNCWASIWKPPTQPTASSWTLSPCEVSSHGMWEPIFLALRLHACKVVPSSARLTCTCVTLSEQSGFDGFTALLRSILERDRALIWRSSRTMRAPSSVPANASLRFPWVPSSPTESYGPRTRRILFSRPTLPFWSSFPGISQKTTYYLPSTSSYFLLVLMDYTFSWLILFLAYSADSKSICCWHDFSYSVRRSIIWCMLYPSCHRESLRWSDWSMGKFYFALLYWSKERFRLCDWVMVFRGFYWRLLLSFYPNRLGLFGLCSFSALSFRLPSW